MPRALVIGSPIEHSLSPALHEAGYRAAGLTGWGYDRHEVVAAELPGFLEALPDDVVGLSVTMPCKEAALGFAQTSSELARETQSANTLVRGGDSWFADNTDVVGVVRALEDAGAHGSHAVVIGSGATARSVVAGLAQLGIREVTFVVRNTARPETLSLARHLGLSVVVVRESDPEVAPILGFATLIVSTPPAHGADSLANVLADAPTTRIGVSGAPVIMDVVYAGWPTALARAAHGRRARVVSGIEMLVHQAGAQFEMFTGHPAPIADMMRVGREAVAG